MRVIVLGGTAFIGRALVHELHAAGHEVMVVHRGNHEPDDLPAVQHLHVDRKELASVKDGLAAFRPDAAVDNIAMSKASARGALGALPDGIRLVVTSSMDVYRSYTAVLEGRIAEPLPEDEESPVREVRYPYKGKIPEFGDVYEKLDVEEAYLARGATVLRLPMVYGPHDGQRREEFMLRRVRANRKRIPTGTGSWLGTRGFVADIARGMRLALESDTPGEIFNLGEERTFPAGLWARMILEAAGSDAELVRVPDDKLPEDLEELGALPQHLLVSSHKAKHVLGWKQTDPAEALRTSVAWHLAHPPEDAPEDFSADDEALAAAG